MHYHYVLLVVLYCTVILVHCLTEYCTLSVKRAALFEPLLLSRCVRSRFRKKCGQIISRLFCPIGCCDSFSSFDLRYVFGRPVFVRLTFPLLFSSVGEPLWCLSNVP